MCSRTRAVGKGATAAGGAASVSPCAAVVAAAGGAAAGGADAAAAALASTSGASHSMASGAGAGAGVNWTRVAWPAALSARSPSGARRICQRAARGRAAARPVAVAGTCRDA